MLDPRIQIVEKKTFINWLVENKKIAVAIFIFFLALLSSILIFRGKTAGEVAGLYLSPATTIVMAGTNFDVDLRLDTKNNPVVAVKGIVKYNPADFELVSSNTSSSVFFTAGNTCTAQNNNVPCEIINRDDATGTISITQARPTPGVNTASGQIARLTFKTKKAFTATTPNILVNFIAIGNYTDSDVIFDDGLGTDILSGAFITNTLVSKSDLPAPSGLAPDSPSATSMELFWNPVLGVGVTGYKVFRNNVQVGTSVVNIYTDTNLTPLTAYQYTVSSVDGAGHESAQSAIVSGTTLADTTKPVVPTGLAASNIGMDNLTLSWTASTDDVAVTGYNIYRNTTKIGTSTTNNFQVTGLNPDTTYSLSVSAFDAATNESNPSTAITLKTALDTQAPSIPSNVTATASSVSQINLTWTASSDNSLVVTNYKIYRDGNATAIATIPATTTYSDTGLTANSQHTYQVSAVDARNNESIKSNVASATTNSDTQAPTAPSNLTGEAISMTGIYISWTASTDNVGIVGYRVFRNGTQIDTSGTITLTNLQDASGDLIRNTAYTYTVVAYDAAGNQSAPSNQITVTTLADNEKPTVPASLTAIANSMTQITISWNASTDNIEVKGYKLYDNGVEIANQATRTFIHTGLTAGSAHSYTVLAYDVDNNESAQSTAVTVSTQTRKYSIGDFTTLVGVWLQNVTSSPVDINANPDGIVDTRDLGIMMSNWEPNPNQ